MNILEIKNLTIKNIRNNDILLNNVNLFVNKGETLGIVGQSGSGKTLTGLSVTGLLDKSIFEIVSGNIIYNGINLLEEPEEKLQKIRSNKISIIFQEPMLSLNPVQSINSQLTEVIKLHVTQNLYDIKEIAKEIIVKTGLQDYKKILNSYPHMLSGGQRQRVMIAIALVCKPDILIADEPTTALDVTLQLQILDLLSNFKSQNQMSMILISHDLDLIKKYTDRVCIMNYGNIIESGLTEYIFDKPQNKYTKDLIASRPEKIINHEVEGKILLQAKNINCKFPINSTFFKKNRKYFHALSDVNFIINEGETIGIVGESGSGKTTLAMTILQLLKYDGDIFFDGKEISDMPDSALRNIRKDFQIVFQDPFSSLSPRMTIFEILTEGITILDKKMTREQLLLFSKDLLNEVGLQSEMIHRYPHQFSGGQRQRIAIARALSMKPKLIIFDEPTSALDVLVQKSILELIVNLQKKFKISYCFISHDLKVIRSISHRIYVIKDSRIIENNNTETIINFPKEDYTKKLIESSFIRN